MLFAARVVLAADSPNPFLGHWALTIPGGAAGWLGVTESQGKLSASLLWGGGSVLPLADAKVVGHTLVLTRQSGGGRRNASGAAATTETITAKIDGDKLKLTTVKSRPNQPEFDKAEFTGKRTPPLPPAPDLSKVKFGTPIKLFNGLNLDGWKLTNPRAANGWSVKDGALSNNPVQEQGQPHKNYGNLRTEREFEDFNLTLEVSVAPRGNSGIYLRGIYEIQIADSFGRPVDSHNMGAIYSRITPSEAAEKQAGEWQTLDVTLVDRHATVVLNGKKIIDNQPILGCTGGALWSDPLRPGPIYLQGDHSVASFRNMVLRPVVKSY
ncbi:MAG: DUF1080 domain-containing protein [Verrucomicrobia bacterium]|nr:DUF1080 domain-containing protein [Verrucomicrobiota bacterium]